MHHPKWLLLAAPALLAAVPAAAQGHPAPIPAPGGAVPAMHPDLVGPATGPMRAPPPRVATRVWQDGRWTSLPPRRGTVGTIAPDRWGRTIEGRWHGGFDAPGGWRAYRRLGRGHHLPRYWMDRSFRVPDYLTFGLAAPPPGYFWVRYYDDAVLVDDRGNVWDSVDGIAWTGGAYASAHGYAGADVGAGYVQPSVPVDPDVFYEPAPPPGAYGPQPPPPRVAIAPPPPPPPVVMAAPPPPSVQVRTYPPAGYGYGYGYGYAAASYQGGAYFYGAPTTTVVVTSAPVTTTTVVEEVIEEEVVTTYVRAKPRRVVRKHRAKPRPKPKPKCCVCVCR